MPDGGVGLRGRGKTGLRLNVTLCLIFLLACKNAVEFSHTENGWKIERGPVDANDVNMQADAHNHWLANTLQATEARYNLYVWNWPLKKQMKTPKRK